MKRIFAFMGLDRAIVYTLAGRGWSLIAGVFNLLLVARFLTSDEQGYYYTFASLLAMQVFFELGMSFVVMQFASHEMAHLFWLNDGTINGDVASKSRLHSLLLLVTKWYGVVAALIMIVVLPAGWVFFSTNHPLLSVNWQIAWIWLVFTAAVNICFLPVLSLLEGCGRISEVAKLRLYQNIVGSIAAWVFLMNGGGLLALPAMNTGLALTALIWLWRSKRNFIRDLLRNKEMSGSRVEWRNEIWPLQWKIALSWMSGYFIFQLFTPVLFVYRGATEAGQIGMSFSVVNALMSIPIAWMSTKAPLFGILVANKDYSQLDSLFRLTLLRSFIVMVTGGIVLCIANYALHAWNVAFATRFLDPVPFIVLILATTLNYVTYAQSAYLRAHKEEPFLLISIVSAVLIAGLTFGLAKQYGAVGVLLGYFAVCMTVGFGWGSWIFFSKKSEWQKSCARITEKNIS